MHQLLEMFFQSDLIDPLLLQCQVLSIWRNTSESQLSIDTSLHWIGLFLQYVVVAYLLFLHAEVFSLNDIIEFCFLCDTAYVV